jgi:hypothetical protein
MLIDNEDELPSELDAEEAKITDVEPELPERYRNKSVQDIVKMHQEAEKVIGRQAQEVGEVRKLADDLIKQNLTSKPQHVEKEEPEVDFFADPQRAIQSTINSHPDVLAAKQASLEFKRMQFQQKLTTDHPDYIQLVNDQEFANWVKSSPVRIGLYSRADAELDYDSANELLSTFKQLRGIKTQQVEKSSKEARQQTMRAAQVDTGGTGEGSKRVYRRADLIRLKMTDPARYDALSDEIMQAYAEGRVK